MGEKPLRRALEYHPTAAAYVGENVFKQVRHGKEFRVTSRAVVCMIDDFGVRSVKESHAVEILTGRLAAIFLADRTGT